MNTPAINGELSVSRATWDLMLVTDGTSTSCEIAASDSLNPGRVFRLGGGAARRRKGERHDADLGAMLAEYRAVLNAAEGYQRVGAERWGSEMFPPVHDHAEVVKLTQELAEARTAIDHFARRVADLEAELNKGWIGRFARARRDSQD